MKMLRKKGKNEAARKWLKHLIIAYLLASWGVNGVVHPLHYYRNARMRQEPVKISEGADGLAIELPLDMAGERMEYLSFWAEAKDYQFELPLFVYTDKEAAGETKVKVHKGWNTVELSQLSTREALLKKAVILQAAVEAGEIVLSDVVLSEYPKVDTGRMLSVWASFLLLLAFWEAVWWIKARYAE